MTTQFKLDISAEYGLSPSSKMVIPMCNGRSCYIVFIDSDNMEVSIFIDNDLKVSIFEDCRNHQIISLKYSKIFYGMDAHKDIFINHEEPAYWVREGANTLLIKIDDIQNTYIFIDGLSMRKFSTDEEITELWSRYTD